MDCGLDFTPARHNGSEVFGDYFLHYLCGMREGLLRELEHVASLCCDDSMSRERAEKLLRTMNERWTGVTLSLSRDSLVCTYALTGVRHTTVLVRCPHLYEMAREVIPG